MHPLIWKTLAALALIYMILQQLNIPHWPRRSFSAQHELTYAHDVHYSTPNTGLQPVFWQYDWPRDRDDYTLSTAQCEAAFPDLYYEIRRARTRWQDHHITESMIALDDRVTAGLHVLIAANTIRIIAAKGIEHPKFRSRIFGVLHQLQRAITSVEEVEKKFPNAEFTIDLDRHPYQPIDENSTVWSSIRNPLDDNVWVVPDHTWWNVPPDDTPFDDAQAMARTHSSLLANKKPITIWRGDTSTDATVREDLLYVAKDSIWADVRVLDESEEGADVALADLCDHQFLISPGDRSSVSRLTSLLNCDSVPVISDTSLATHYSHLLEPNISYVPVASDFSNLPDQIEYYLVDEEEAQDIADNARKTFRERYTTPAATACYWRKLLRVWSSVSFAPRVFGESYPQAGDWEIRGTSFDDFLLRDSETDHPNADAT